MGRSKKDEHGLDRMKIDLSQWNEFIADDVPKGAIPCGVSLEIMQMVTCDSYRKVPIDDFPTGIESDQKTMKCRLFWRIKE